MNVCFGGHRCRVTGILEELSKTAQLWSGLDRPDRHCGGETRSQEAESSVIDIASLEAVSAGSNCGGPPQRQSTQHVVGEREPQQHGAGLRFAAHQQPGEPHAARPGIGALGLRAFLVEGFARFTAMRRRQSATPGLSSRRGA